MADCSDYLMTLNALERNITEREEKLTKARDAFSLEQVQLVVGPGCISPPSDIFEGAAAY